MRRIKVAIYSVNQKNVFGVSQKISFRDFILAESSKRPVYVLVVNIVFVEAGFSSWTIKLILANAFLKLICCT